MKPYEHIILPLDVDTAEKAIDLVTLLKNEVGVFKVGLELTNVAGTNVIARLKQAGAARIFVDAKLHDIPNTVMGAMRGIVRHGAWCVTVHTLGGTGMLKAAVEAAKCEAEAIGVERPKILGVTLLTSISQNDLEADLKISTPLSEYVCHLANLAYKCGCDGVIASPDEIQAIRQSIPDPDFLIVTPGVRPTGSEKGDQARVLTPGEAIKRGSSYLVIGRPIHAASNPLAAARAIAAEIAAAVAGSGG